MYSAGTEIVIHAYATTNGPQKKVRASVVQYNVGTLMESITADVLGPLHSDQRCNFKSTFSLKCICSSVSKRPGQCCYTHNQMECSKGLIVPLRPSCQNSSVTSKGISMFIVNDGTAVHETTGNTLTKLMLGQVSLSAPDWQA